ncbi:MAG: hypothetical protein AAF191_09895 [Verrucomicrobiota bacterium]
MNRQPDRVLAIFVVLFSLVTLFTIVDHFRKGSLESVERLDVGQPLRESSKGDSSLNP